MSSLPLDLLRPIVENLADDFRSLQAVSLGSHQLRVEGQRILFRKAAFSYYRGGHSKFLTVVTSSSLLASLVEEYHQFDLLGRVDLHEPLWGLTCRGLQSMVNLKILVFRSWYGHPSAQILHGCTFQLEALKWESCDDEELLLEFLIDQPHLHALKVDWKRPALDTSGVCPGLQVLHGDRNTINAFLPGRRVTSLKWTPNRDEVLLNHSIDHLSEEFHYIRFFTFGGFWGRPRLDLVIRHLRAVEVLELVGLETLAVSVCLNFFFLRLCTLSHEPYHAYRTCNCSPKFLDCGCSSSHIKPTAAREVGYP